MSQKTSKKKLVLNSIIYSLSGILLKCFSFFLLPLYTMYLTTEDYGITSISGSFVDTAVFVVAFSLFSAVMRFYVDLKEDPEKLKRFYGTIITFVFLSAALFGVLATVFRGVLTEYVFNGIDYYPVILITLVNLVFCCQVMIYDNILQSQQRAVKFSALNIVFFFVTLTLNIVFVVVLRMGAVGSLLATTVSMIVHTLYFLADMIRQHEIHFCLDLKLLKSALRYSIPIMPHNLSTQLSMLISKILIGGSVSMSGVGIYSLASQFGNIADTLQSYVDQAYGPWLYEKLHNRESGFKEGIRSIAQVLTTILGLFFLGIALFAQDYIFLLLEESYKETWKYVPPIILCFAIKTAYYFYVEVLFYYKEASRKLFIATLTSSLMNILLASVLVPRYGIAGSLMAELLSMFIRVVIVISISKKYENIGLHVIDFVKVFLMTAVFMGIGLAPSFIFRLDAFSVYNFLYKGVVVLLYIGCNLIRYKSQLKPVQDMIKKKLGKEHS